MGIEIREYRSEDEVQWMRVHAIILSISHSWNYSIQERTLYEAYDSTRLVAFDGDKLVGLIDVQYDKEDERICFLKDSLGGYVLEFGRLPEYGKQGIGELLMDAAVADAKAKGYTRLEYWSQDRNAQRFYARLGLPEIGRHYRFRFHAPQEVTDLMIKDFIGVEYLYGACIPEEWPLIKKQYDIIEKHPLEPHLCIGYELRF